MIIIYAHICLYSDLHGSFEVTSSSVVCVGYDYD